MAENAAEKVKPYSQDGSKKEQIAQMFDNISGNYDLLNHLLSHVPVHDHMPPAGAIVRDDYDGDEGPL